MKNNFLHNHPRMESELGIDDEHVIVDKKDWFILQKALRLNPSLIENILELDGYFTNKEYKLNYIKIINQDYKL